MGSLAERLDAAAEAAVPVPAKYQQHATWDDQGGEGATGPIREKVTDSRRLLELAGLDPDAWRIVGKISQWTKTHNGKPDTYSFFFQFEPATAVEDAIDLPALFHAAERRPRQPLTPVVDGPVTVVVLADVQAGKTGSRGGTPELIIRLAEKRQKLAAHLRTRKPTRTVLIEAGDLFENFESGGNPMFTNDLSLSQQMDLAGTIVYDFIKVLHRHGRVDVVAIPSNHTAWRRGSVNLGRPGDDLGMFVHRQVQKITSELRMNVEWTYPADFDESVALDVDGTVLGVVHGNQYRPGKAIDWWSRQGHGGQPVGAADVLIGGHYHSFMCIPTGRNPRTGRVKWFLQAPTLDSGSDWFRNIAGEDSDPGLMVFDVTSTGFDLASLTIL